MSKVKLTKEEKAQLKHEKFLKRMEDTFGDEYTVLGFYTTTAKPLLIKHNKCNYEWDVYPGYLFTCHKNQKRCCPRCSGKERYTTESFAEEINRLGNGEYVLLGEYKSCKEKTIVKHLSCGYKWLTSSNIFHTGCRCPKCAKSISKGERKISDHLIENKINHKYEYIFNDCKDTNSLKFDFAIFNDNDLICIIEYDGEQHFHPVDFAGRGQEWAEEQFETCKQRDQIKNQYCEDNNIPLLRIPYWDFDNIEKILDREFIRVN